MRNSLTTFAQYILGSRLQSSLPLGAADCSPLLAYVDRSELVASDKLIRFGSAYGGWQIPCDPEMSSDSVCYLAGAGEDITFDCELVRRFCCQIRIIDPTPKAILHFRQLTESVNEGRPFHINNNASEFYDISAAELASVRFLPVGLADQDTELKFYTPKNPEHVSCSTINLQKTDQYFVAKCYRLATLVDQQGDQRIDLIKMDIEGAEYMVIKDMIASGLLPRILLIEFDEAHSPLDEHAGDRIRDHIRLLNHAGMRCIAVEDSNATFVRADP